MNHSSASKNPASSQPPNNTTTTPQNQQQFSLSNPNHQNYLLDLFFDKFYSAAWNSLDQLEYALKKILKKGLRDSSAASSHASSSNATRKTKLTSSQKMLIKNAIDQFMENHVEPELKKCMDLFEIVAVEEVLPRLDDKSPASAAAQKQGKSSKRHPTHDAMQDDQETEAAPSTATAASKNTTSSGMTPHVTAESSEQNMKRIQEAHAQLERDAATLRFLSMQEALMEKYAPQLQQLHADLKEESMESFHSIEALHVKRRELQKIYSQLKNSFNGSGIRQRASSAEDRMEDDVQTPTTSTVSTPPPRPSRRRSAASDDAPIATRRPRRSVTRKPSTISQEY